MGFSSRVVRRHFIRHELGVTRACYCDVVRGESGGVAIKSYPDDGPIGGFALEDRRDHHSLGEFSLEEGAALTRYVADLDATGGEDRYRPRVSGIFGFSTKLDRFAWDATLDFTSSARPVLVGGVGPYHGNGKGRSAHHAA